MNKTGKNTNKAGQLTDRALLHHSSNALANQIVVICHLYYNIM